MDFAKILGQESQDGRNLILNAFAGFQAYSDVEPSQDGSFAGMPREGFAPGFEPKKMDFGGPAA